MQTSKFFVAVAAIGFAGSALAFNMPVTSATATSAAAAVLAPAAYSAKNLNVPTVQDSKSTAQKRTEVRDQAVEAVRNDRSTFQVQLDFLKG